MRLKTFMEELAIEVAVGQAFRIPTRPSNSITLWRASATETRSKSLNVQTDATIKQAKKVTQCPCVFPRLGCSQGSYLKKVIVSERLIFRMLWRLQVLPLPLLLPRASATATTTTATAATLTAAAVLTNIAMTKGALVAKRFVVIVAVTGCRARHSRRQA